jgi:ATP-dependent Lon protease
LKQSIYIHCNNAGIEKDGPSAGLAFFLLHWSRYTMTPIPYNWAFTGELTIRGDIDPVGGIV